MSYQYVTIIIFTITPETHGKFLLLFKCLLLSYRCKFAKTLTFDLPILDINCIIIVNIKSSHKHFHHVMFIFTPATDCAKNLAIVSLRRLHRLTWLDTFWWYITPQSIILVHLGTLKKYYIKFIKENFYVKSLWFLFQKPFCLFVSIYWSLLPVAHLSDAPRKWFVVLGIAQG